MNPTPVEIANAIHAALIRDFQANPYNGQNLPIPARVHSLINDAIAAACAKKAEASHAA